MDTKNKNDSNSNDASFIEFAKEILKTANDLRSLIGPREAFVQDGSGNVTSEEQVPYRLSEPLTTYDLKTWELAANFWYSLYEFSSCLEDLIILSESGTVSADGRNQIFDKLGVLVPEGNVEKPSAEATALQLEYEKDPQKFLKSIGLAENE